MNARTVLDGPVARALGASFEPRPQQARMAEEVEKTLASRAHLMAEAGTGTGKSFAYLVPAIRRCVEHGEVVVVSTHTIALQEQILTKDIPVLMGAMGLEDSDALRPVLVKGRGNYVSLRRLGLTQSRASKLLPDAAARRSLAVIQEWAESTEDGTVSTLPGLERADIWDRVQSDSGNCMGRRCPTHESCFYQRSRRAMERGNLLVCNHAVFFSDLAIRAASDTGFLPRYDHVILDEAHTAEEVASDHFGVKLSEGSVYHLLGALHGSRTGKGFLPTMTLAAGDTGMVERAIGCVEAADAAAREMFADLARAAGRLGSSGRVREPGIVENHITPAMNELTIALRRLKETVKTEADMFELNAYAERSAAIADWAETLIDQRVPGCCYWIEARPGFAGRSRVTLACSPIEVGPILSEQLFGKDCSVVMTSATLATRGIEEDEPAERAEAAFAHALGRLGAEGAGTLQVGSPFDYAEQLEVYVERGMPEPRGSVGGAAGDAAYVEAVAGRVLEHVSATEGGAFVLFTSFALLESVAVELAVPLEELGYELLVQSRGVGGESRTALVERFRSHEGDGRGAVLLGAASFWQGVDVRGAALRNVIITRLPFDPPGRALVEARGELIRARGGDPFREDAVPRAVIRFKQGVGRLIRSRDDRGRVVVLDPRVVTKGYGGSFLRAIPPGAPVHEIG